MVRQAIAFMAVILLALPTMAEDSKPRVELSGSIDDESLQKEMPANRVIVSQKAWEKLAKAWGITDAPKIDFTKEILIVGTWRGSQFDLMPVIQNGDLMVGTRGTKDLRPGFRWKVQTLSREGIKSVLGMELPKE
jgi:hypothetical protein